MKRGYNRRNLCKKIIEMQGVYMQYWNTGRTDKFIYDTFIYPRFFISRATFYKWLGTNAKAELKKLEAEQGQQLNLNFGEKE